MSNIDTLREHLFSTLQGLKNGSIDVEKAKVMGEVAQVIINSAKVEVDFIRANGGGNSKFISGEVGGRSIGYESFPENYTKQTPNGKLTVNGNSTVHKLR